MVNERVIPSSSAVGKCDRSKWFCANISDDICGGDGPEDDRAVGDTFPDEVLAHVDVFRVAIMHGQGRSLPVVVEVTNKRKVS